MVTSIIYTILGLATSLILIRILSFQIELSKIEESSSNIIYLEKPWYLLYSSYTFDPSENYNWIKISADIKKGVDEVLAVQREFVITSEIEMYNLKDNFKNLIVSNDDGNIYLKNYETFLSEQLLLLESLEAQHTLRESLQSLEEGEFKDLLEALIHPENFDKED